jgi:hypothetical protein
METEEEDMEIELLIAIGGRVMLTSNIWKNAGLANGDLGAVQ